MHVESEQLYGCNTYVGVSSMLVWWEKVQSTKLRLPEDDADALKHVGGFMIHKILLLYIYIYVLCIGSSG